MAISDPIFLRYLEINQIGKIFMKLGNLYKYLSSKFNDLNIRKIIIPQYHKKDLKLILKNKDLWIWIYLKNVQD
jgi:hypothetical protein